PARHLWTGSLPLVHTPPGRRNRHRARITREPKPLLTSCGKLWGFSWITRWATPGEPEDEPWTDVDRCARPPRLLGTTRGHPVDGLGTGPWTAPVIGRRSCTGRRNHRRTRGELVENRGMTWGQRVGTVPPSPGAVAPSTP